MKFPLARALASAVGALCLTACAPLGASATVDGAAPTPAPACANLILHLHTAWPESAATLSTVAGAPLLYQQPVGIGGVLVRVCPAAGDSLTAIVSRLQQQPQVIHAEPDSHRHPQQAPATGRP